MQAPIGGEKCEISCKLIANLIILRKFNIKPGIFEFIKQPWCHRLGNYPCNYANKPVRPVSLSKQEVALLVKASMD